MLARGRILRSTPMSSRQSGQIAVIGIDIGKNFFHVVCLDKRGTIILRQKWSRTQVEARFANMPPCLIRMEACIGAHPRSAISSSNLPARRVFLKNPHYEITNNLWPLISTHLGLSQGSEYD